MGQNYDFSKMNDQIKLLEEAPVLGEAWESTWEFLEEAANYVFKYGVGWTIALIIGVPTLTMPWGVYSESIYNLWASAALMWGYIATFVIISLPLYESWGTIRRVLTCNPIQSSIKGVKTTRTDAAEETELQQDSSNAEA